MQKTPESPTGEHTVLLEHTSWQTYERLIEEREERPVPRFFYDRGVLEIVSPSTRHEAVSRTVALLIGLLAMEMELDMLNAGSTTFKREDLQRGFEPDECLYFSGNVSRVRSKADIDLAAGDPPPDMVFEVDLSSHSLDKLSIYARLGVPEIWRYTGGGGLQVLVLDTESESYHAVGESRVLAPLTAEALTRFVEKGLTEPYPVWARAVQEWMRSQRP